MEVLVDTSIWSLALRRSVSHLTDLQRNLVNHWADLIQEGQVVVIGPIRQEILSGIRREADFQRLRKRLADFYDLPLLTTDYEQAASLFNRCRSRGLTGTPTDLLICAVAERLGLPIFTTDEDFQRYAKYLPIRLHQA